MRIGEVARHVGLRASALRYYESLGLLPPTERVSGRRVYGERILDRVVFIQFAQECGFSLNEVAVLLGMGQSSGRSSERLRKLAARKIDEVNAQIERAQGMKRMLEAALNCECVTADQCGKIIRVKMAERTVSTP
jgi:MerR family transcriptional regulator, redox-sensitive transcriptional activator SoxR